MGEHSINGPSSFSRRIGCPGSANMELPLPNTSSKFAAEGTAAHELGELCLRDNSDPEDYEGEKVSVDNQDGTYSYFVIDQDMIDAVKIYVDYCRELQVEGQYFIESKFALPFLGENQKGTADHVAVKNKILHVTDYKHGRGVPVDAIGNVQGVCYGLGAADTIEQTLPDLEWDVLRITIVQPRAYHEEGVIRSWDIPRNELIDYKMDYAHAAVKTQEPDAPLNVGDWCRFCKAKPTCPQQVIHAEKLTQMDFSDPSSLPVEPQYISDDVFADLVLNRVKIIEQWCQSVKDHAQNLAEAGNPIPGTKLVATRANRMWRDKELAETQLAAAWGDKVYQKKFMSAPQVEKAIGKKEFGLLTHMVDKVSTGVTLVPESDKRPSVRPSVELEFG